jgi:hypothetical protein
MSKRDLAIHWGVTLFVVVPVFSFCWARGAYMLARERLTGTPTASA